MPQDDNMIDVQPLFFKDGKPLNDRLFNLAMEFCDREFGQNSVRLSDYTTVWVAVKGEPGEIPECVGVQGLRYHLDLGLHHVKSTSKGHDCGVSAKLIHRLNDFLHDRGYCGLDLMVFCEQDNLGNWKKFFESMGAVPAQRFLMRVKNGVEV
jgi:hypothetical protein